MIVRANPKENIRSMNKLVIYEPNRRLSLVVSALLGGLLLLPACSSSQNNSSSAGSSNSSPSSSSQPSIPTSVSPSANATSGQTASASPVMAALPTPHPEHLAGIGSASIVTIHGKIVSVDRPNKLVTLEGPGGKKVTLEVMNPYNLAAAQPDEPVVMKFYEIVTIRKEKPGESLPPVSTAQGIATAMPGETPGGAVGNSVQLVATIVAINKQEKTLN